MRSRPALLVLFGLPFLAGAAGAHDRSASYSSWRIRGGEARVTFRLTSLETTRLAWAAGPGGQERLGAYLVDHLRLLAGETPCAPIGATPRRLEAPPGRTAFEWGLRCPSVEGLRIESTVFLDVAPSHLHFARVRLDDGPPIERILSNDERIWTVSGGRAGRQAAEGTSLAGYLKLGILHILTGSDHLAFLLALLLLGGSIGDVVRIVTGFTIAHSITLALAVLGTLRPERAPIEALIGLSIAMVAAENLWHSSGRRRLVASVIFAALAVLAVAAAAGHGQVPALTLAGLALFSASYFGLLRRVAHPEWLRAAIAFLFGLVHGFGFAGVLMEIGLPVDRLAAALLGFNLGVEIGQLAAVALLWPLLGALRGTASGSARAVVLDLASTAVLALGVFWFVSRAYG
jgi:hypothetical protein